MGSGWVLRRAGLAGRAEGNEAFGRVTRKLPKHPVWVSNESKKECMDTLVIHTYIRTFIHTYIHSCISLSLSVYIYKYTYVCVCVNTCVYGNMYIICMY